MVIYFKRTAIYLFLYLAFYLSLAAQGYIGSPKAIIARAEVNCTAMDNYSESVVYNCQGLQSIFYFNQRDSTCELYAMDMPPKDASDSMQVLSKTGFNNMGIKYLAPFLVSKHSKHEKYPAIIYSNGKIEYCFIPISLTGRIESLNSMVVTHIQKQAEK